MADSSSLAPTGYQVATDGTAGAGLAPGFLGILARGLSGFIDVELARREATIADRSDIVQVTGQNQPISQAAPVVAGGLSAQHLVIGAAALVVVVVLLRG